MHLENYNSDRIIGFVHKTSRKWWGLLILLLLLLIICIANFKPSAGILGWDNFSVSLSLKDNLFRTLFATWRDYRGFGVPSDSEVTDIFRQLLLFPLSLNLSPQIVDQLYYFSLLVIGSIASFFLTKEVLDRLFVTRNQLEAWAIQTASLAGALFYTFSLYSIDVFYLPIVMYAVRFAFFPVLLLLFLRLLKNRHLSGWHLILFLIAALLGSPSYLTATVFFILLLLFAAVIVANPLQIKRSILIFLLFLAVNLFWLLPFINYTSNKGKIIALSSTFALVNEFLFNQFAERFSWDKLLTFSSEFSSGLPFTSISSGDSVKVHEALSYTHISQNVAWYYVLPLPFILIGFLYLMYLAIQRKSDAFWPILLAIGSLFLLRKEYPPLGFLYDYLGHAIPPLKLVLRFGTTKLNPLLLIAFTIMVGVGVFGLIQILKKVRRKYLVLPAKHMNAAKSVGALVLVIWFGWMAYFPLKGSLFFPLLRTSIPREYYALADTINADPSYARVLHLPVGQFSYWRSYKWGYYGSAFFNFMLNKPLLDKTFSPANQDNDFFDFSLNNVFQNAYALDDRELTARAQWLEQLLKRAGVKYVLFDESVDSNIVAKDIKTWEYIQQAEVKQMLDALVDAGTLEIIQTETIDLRSYARRNDVTLSRFNEQMAANPNLILYQLNESVDIIRVAESAVNLEPSVKNGFIKPLYTGDQTIVQTYQYPFRTYPFHNPKTDYEYEEGEIVGSFPDTQSTFDRIVYTHERRTSSPFAVSLYSRPAPGGLEILGTVARPQLGQERTEETLLFSEEVLVENFEALEPEYVTYADMLTNWHALGSKMLSPYRLQVGETVLPLPAEAATGPQYLGTVLLNPGDTEITLLEKTSDLIAVTPAAFRLTEDSNCLLDATEGYSPKLTIEPEKVNLTTANGSFCIAKTIGVPIATRYVEIEISASQSSSGNAQLDQSFTPSNTQKAIERVVNELPNYHSFSICIKNDVEGDCLNSRLSFNGNVPLTNVRVTSEKMFEGDLLQVIIILPTIENSIHQLDISNLLVHEYEPVHSATVSAYYTETGANEIQTAEEESSFSFPPVFSPSSFYMNAQLDALEPRERGKCVLTVGDHRESSIRMYKYSPNGGMLSYISDCYQSIFASLPYISQAFYLWTTDYHVYTGSQPQFIASQPYQLVNEYVSYLDGYPDLPGFKSLQKADPPLPKSDDYYDNVVTEALANRSLVRGHRTMLSQGPIETGTKEYFEVHHTVANQSLVEFTDSTIAALPADWENIYLENGDSELHFASGNVAEVKKILPSLWSFRVTKEATSTAETLILFGQAYDSQWQLYKTDGPLSAIMGHGAAGGHHIKADGWSNGWILSDTELQAGETATFYAFYTPERLAIFGWMLTIAAMAGVGVFVLKKAPERRRRPDRAIFMKAVRNRLTGST